MYLFIFINDLPLDVNNFSTDLYADDTTIMMDICEQNLQISLIQLHIWC